MESEFPSFLLFLGRFHPVVLHLPIGFLLAVVCLEVWGLRRKDRAFDPAIRTSLAVGAIGAILAAVTGWVLSQEGGYTPANTLEEHQNQGILLSVLACLLYFLKRMRSKGPSGHRMMALMKKSYFPLLAFMVVLMIITGHHGAILTHGWDT